MRRTRRRGRPLCPFGGVRTGAVVPAPRRRRRAVRVKGVRLRTLLVGGAWLTCAGCGGGGSGDAITTDDFCLATFNDTHPYVTGDIQIDWGAGAGWTDLSTTSDETPWGQ